MISALVTTIRMALFSGPDGELVEVSAATQRQPQAAPPLVSGVDIVSAADTDEEPGDVDPFAPRGWQAPPPPAPPPSAPLVVAAVDLTPPGPPALPFRFVGSMNDSVEQVVYLARGDLAFVARTGEVLDSQYKVVAIDPTHIEFEYLPSGARQTLAFPARDN
ncbi:hypothetical protein [Duganella sp. HH105]|uniref:hypothetical protein n=1 Tax=Duganella sp. HH105 TaxID=1781067 RepID=UPI000877C970|nr:hypothetical protein [Duganella sp. HH105]